MIVRLDVWLIPGQRTQKRYVRTRPNCSHRHKHYGYAMMYPPALPDDVKARAFHTSNGELGVLPDDAPAFLAACRLDGVEVLGWELWVVNHGWDIQGKTPVPTAGVWCGGIPVNDGDLLAVIGGTGDLSETERELAATDLQAVVQAAWLPYVRVNFTLDD